MSLNISELTNELHEYLSIGIPGGLKDEDKVFLDELIRLRAERLALAIDNYIKSAVVTIESGIPVGNQKGTGLKTTKPGTGALS